LPDVNVLPFFKVRPDETYDALRDRFLCFFGVLFDTVGKNVPNLTSPGPSISSEEIAQKWHGYMNTADNRKTLYKEVVEESDVRFSDTKSLFVLTTLKETMDGVKQIRFDKEVKKSNRKGW
jgi:hypothetical protein